MIPQAHKESLVTEEGRARRILFVCTGNTCRSPMAAALLNDMCRAQKSASSQGAPPPAPTVIAASAGLCAMDGDPITFAAAQVLEEAGIASTPENNYRAHRARTVTKEMIEGADLVIGMTARHALELTVRFPEHAAKISAFPMDISDPFGGDRSLYAMCLMQLRYGITLLLAGGAQE